MPKLTPKTAKPLALILLIIATTLTTLPFTPQVKATTTIISINQTSGNVGTLVNLKANITNTNGQYEIKLDQTLVSSGTATGNDVNATFNIPDANQGNHNITIFDVDKAENASTTFTINTAYLLKTDAPTLPAQLQEGDPVTINVTITGGTQATLYTANVSVTNPNSTKYTVPVNVTTSDAGTGAVYLTYPNQFTNASTNLTGTYTVSYNETSAYTTFFIGLTKSAQYHRTQTIDVKAVYQPFENVTVAISGNVIYNIENWTADDTGIIHYTNWTVPEDALIGTYTVRITSTSNLTKKTPEDAQNFTIPGYAIDFTTRNLAEEPVTDVTLKAIEKGVLVTSNTSDYNGFLRLRLESGTYMCEAYFKGARVGENSITITGDTSLNFSCSLTNLRVIVTDNNFNPIPEVTVNLIEENETLTTDLNGTVVFTSLLPNNTYTVNSSRYDMPFDTTTIPQLPAAAWYNVPIILPMLTLQVTVFDASGNLINNALVRIRERIAGVYFEGTTINGIITHDFLLGRYDIEIYSNGIRLNGTTVDLNQTTVTVPIECQLFGLNVSIKIIDYFGQPIPNTNVTLQNGSYGASSLTAGDGTAAFTNVIGGDLQLAVYVLGQSEPCVAQTAGITNSTTIAIKIDRYSLLAGSLVETNQLITVIIIILVVIFMLSLEILRRRRHKAQKTET